MKVIKEVDYFSSLPRVSFNLNAIGFSISKAMSNLRGGDKM